MVAEKDAAIVKLEEDLSNTHTELSVALSTSMKLTEESTIKQGEIDSQNLINELLDSELTLCQNENKQHIVETSDISGEEENESINQINKNLK